jgi:CheY-like chemotaxis protein
MSGTPGHRVGDTNAPRAASPADRDRRETTVLHVDDDQRMTDTAATFVERELDGVTVVTATSATDGLARAAAGDFDCVVSDLRMPGMDGDEFLRALAPAGVPVVLFTTCDRAAVAAAGCAGYVTAVVRKSGGNGGFRALAGQVRALL